MHTTINFTVRGEPKAQPRPKAFRRGKFIGVYNPHTADEWKQQIRQAWETARPAGFLTLESPLSLTVIFHLPRPEAHYNSRGLLKPSAPKFCPKKPDFDNLMKAVADALTDNGVWRDDSQIVISSTVKVYASRNLAGCEITIRPVEETTTVFNTITRHD